MTPASRRYAREFLPAMAAYAVILMASTWFLRSIEAIPLRALLALLPFVPVVYAARALLHFLHAMDEFQRKLQLEAFALAALALTLGSFALGLLAAADVIAPPVDLVLMLVLPAFCVLHGLFACVAARRYR
ncbi:hypothetical protein [Luteimonas yindakuii]|uniref:hypothetical protein n=1 Tax=Luteimonas yindakuii TaxID=2565782 RepID=UPI0010A36AAE|nr:hypothetical protein [Luteimonas yindakuii]